MKSNELLDIWHETGSDFAGFKQKIQDITESTYTVPVQLSDMQLLPVITEESTEKRVALHVYDALLSLQKSHSTSGLSIEKCMENNMPDEFLTEVKERTKLLVRLQDGTSRIFFTSSYLCRDLAARAQLAGDAIYTPSELRDAYIMSLLANTNKKAYAVIRKSSDASMGIFHKMFGLPSYGYCYIPQTTLLDIISELDSMLGKSACEFWEIDHSISRIWLSYPGKAEDISKVYGLPDTLIPGVLLETSDTSDCSLRVVATWKRDSGARATIGVYEREHRGRFDFAKAIKQVKDDLMPTYTELPERLCELMTIDLPDPAAAIAKTISMLNVAKKIGSKVANSLRDCLQDELTPGQKMTGYDLAMLFMDLPGRYPGEQRYKEFFEKAAGSVAFLDYDKIAAATSTVVLVPAS